MIDTSQEENLQTQEETVIPKAEDVGIPTGGVAPITEEPSPIAGTPQSEPQPATPLFDKIMASATPTSIGGKPVVPTADNYTNFDDILNRYSVDEGTFFNQTFDGRSTTDNLDSKIEAYKEAKNNAGSSLVAFGMGLEDAALFGFGDELNAFIESIFTREDYQEVLRSTRVDFENARIYFPVAYGAGELSATVAEIGITLAASIATGGLAAPTLAATGGKAVAKAFGKEALKLAGKEALIGAGMGMASGLGYSNAIGEDELELGIKSALMGGVFGASVGGLSSVGGGIAQSALASAGKKLSKHRMNAALMLGETLSGVDEKILRDVVDDKNAIKGISRYMGDSVALDNIVDKQYLAGLDALAENTRLTSTRSFDFLNQTGIEVPKKDILKQLEDLRRTAKKGTAEDDFFANLIKETSKRVKEVDGDFLNGERLKSIYTSTKNAVNRGDVSKTFGVDAVAGKYADQVANIFDTAMKNQLSQIGSVPLSVGGFEGYRNRTFFRDRGKKGLFSPEKVRKAIYETLDDDIKIRFGLGDNPTEQEIDKALKIIERFDKDYGLALDGRFNRDNTIPDLFDAEDAKKAIDDVNQLDLFIEGTEGVQNALSRQSRAEEMNRAIEKNLNLFKTEKEFIQEMEKALDDRWARNVDAEESLLDLEARMASVNKSEIADDALEFGSTDVNLARELEADELGELDLSKKRRDIKREYKAIEQEGKDVLQRRKELQSIYRREKGREKFYDEELLHAIQEVSNQKYKSAKSYDALNVQPDGMGRVDALKYYEYLMELDRNAIVAMKDAKRDIGNGENASKRIAKIITGDATEKRKQTFDTIVDIINDQRIDEPPIDKDELKYALYAKIFSAPSGKASRNVITNAAMWAGVGSLAGLLGANPYYFVLPFAGVSIRTRERLCSTC